MSVKRKLGEILIEIGAITANQLNSALAHQQRYQHKLKLGASLVALGFLTEEKLTQALGSYLKMPFVDLSSELITPDLFHLVPADVAEKFQIMPFKLFEENRKKVLGLAMSDPTNLEPIDVIQFKTGLNIRPYVASPSDIERAIQRYYHGIIIDGISYVGRIEHGDGDPAELSGSDKIKIISQGHEITWHGGVKLGENRQTPAGVKSIWQTTPGEASTKVSTTKSGDGSANEMMGEMLKLMRESNAMMRVLVKKGIISEEDLENEINQK